jgi:hypothetical protein
MPKKYKVNKYDAGKIEEVKPKIKMSDMFELSKDSSKGNKFPSKGVKDKKKKPKSKKKKSKY